MTILCDLKVNKYKCVPNLGQPLKPWPLEVCTVPRWVAPQRPGRTNPLRPPGAVEHAVLGGCSAAWPRASLSASGGAPPVGGHAAHIARKSERPCGRDTSHETVIEKHRTPHKREPCWYWTPSTSLDTAGWHVATPVVTNVARDTIVPREVTRFISGTGRAQVGHRGFSCWAQRGVGRERGEEGVLLGSD